jgi:predicted nucleic acid-binding protein
MLYLDTSALLKLYLREEGSEWVQARVASQSDPLPVWELQEAELTNALRLKVFWRDITAAQAEGQLDHFRSRKARGQYVFPLLDRAALMERFRQLSFHSMKLGTRTLDVMHVACACELHADHFVSFDERQCSLAKHAGLSVIQAPPGGLAR